VTWSLVPSGSPADSNGTARSSASSLQNCHAAQEPGLLVSGVPCKGMPWPAACTCGFNQGIGGVVGGVFIQAVLLEAMLLKDQLRANSLNPSAGELANVDKHTYLCTYSHQGITYVRRSLSVSSKAREQVVHFHTFVQIQHTHSHTHTHTHVLSEQQGKRLGCASSNLCKYNKHTHVHSEQQGKKRAGCAPPILCKYKYSIPTHMFSVCSKAV